MNARPRSDPESAGPRFVLGARRAGRSRACTMKRHADPTTHCPEYRFVGEVVNAVRGRAPAAHRLDIGQRNGHGVSMRQLTSLDTQFLAMETASQYGHVAGLVVLDPRSREAGPLDLATLQQHLADRLPLVPPLRWRLAEVPFGLDYSYWVDDPDFDLEFHVRELALPLPGNGRSAGRAGRAHRRPPARSLAPAVGAVPDPRSRRRPRRRPDQDPPQRHRRLVGRRDHGGVARPDA